jgi:mono/diheme cytochrome c family protein
VSASTIKLAAAFVIGILTLPLLILFWALAGLFPADAVSRPPGWESAIGQRALKASLAARAKSAVNPVRPNDEAALLAGMTTFRNDCAGCHGDAKLRSPWGEEDFYPRVPQFKRTPAPLTPEETYVAVRYGIRYSGMGAWNGQLTDTEIWQVANFVSRMRTLPPAVDRAWHTELAASGKN